MALLVLYFAPDTLRVPDNFRAVSERLLVRVPSPYPALPPGRLRLTARRPPPRRAPGAWPQRRNAAGGVS